MKIWLTVTQECVSVQHTSVPNFWYWSTKYFGLNDCLCWTTFIQHSRSRVLNLLGDPNKIFGDLPVVPDPFSGNHCCRIQYVQWNTVYYDMVRYRMILCNTVRYDVVSDRPQYVHMQLYIMIQWNTIGLSMMLCSTVLGIFFSTADHSIEHYSTVQVCALWT